MRLSFIIFSFCLFQLSASVYSQNGLFTIETKDITMRELFHEIEQQSQFRFFYNDVLTNIDQKISINLKDKNIIELLDIVVANSGITYRVLDNKLIVVSPVALLQQGITITGTVTDADGQPLPGASVVVKGTLQGTVTGTNGVYSLQVPDENTTLVFSFIGFAGQEFSVGNRRTINVILSEDTREIEEVVVVGYGTMRKSDLTGSVQSVKSQEILATPATNILETLQGKVSGMDMTKSSGQAGASVSFNIRGNRSLTAQNDPLIIVDGYTYGTTLDINASDVESIEILKDASSTAIYGTRGANGVILITTKKGRAGKPKVSFNAYYTINDRTAFPRVMDGDEYAQYKREAYRTTNGNEMSTGSFIANPYRDDSAVFPASLELKYVQDRQYEYWPDLVVKTGHTQNYEVNVVGGNENTTYVTSMGFMQEDGIVIDDRFRRFNARIGLDQKLTKTLGLGANIVYTYKNHDMGHDAFLGSVQTLPIAKAWNDDGSLNLWPCPGYTTTLNPLAYYEIDNSYVNNTISKRAIINLNASWEIIPGLLYKSVFNSDLNDSRHGSYNQGFESLSDSKYESSFYTNYQVQNMLTYTTKLDKHDFQVLLGQEFYKSWNESSAAGGKGQFSSINQYNSLQATTSAQSVFSDLYQSAVLSFFGRINYRYADKYLLTASVRADRASVLAPDKQWGAFPSVALAWRINQEDFLKDALWLTNLKLRGSWGVTGNSAISPYQTFGMITQSYYTFNNTFAPGYYPSSMANKLLTWEKTSSFNAGIDFGFWNNRLSGNVDFFVANTYDLLLESKLPSTSGYTETMENVGKTRNLGIDGAINAHIIKSTSFNWNLGFNFTHVKEEIRALNSGQTKDEANGWFVGEPVKTYYQYKFAGIWQISEYEEARKYGLTYGEIKLTDTNGDGTITPEDRVIFNRSPKFIFGLNNNFAYKNFDLSIFIYGRLGYWLSYQHLGGLRPNALNNWFSHDYWTPENQINTFPRPTERATVYTYNSTLQYEKGDFLKIRDITLGYTLPENVVSKLHVSNLRFYVAAKNYFTISKVKDYDPERGGSASFPLIKQIVFGLNLNF